MNPFLLDTNYYQRDMDILTAARNDMALFISRSRNVSYEEAAKFVENELKRKDGYGLRNPTMKLLTKNKVGDREQTDSTFHHFMEGILANKQLLSPSLTVYENATVKKSILAEYIQVNLALRQSDKHMAKEKEIQGKMDEYSFWNIMQNTRKVKNNSLSGAQVTISSALFNKNGHPTLTSNCRAATGYGNSNNEKFLGGNRHYWSPDVTFANIVSIISHTDLVALEKVMVKYGIHYPTADEVFECVHKSTVYYWYSPTDNDVVRNLITNLQPIERAAVLYNGDLFHLAKYNDALVRDFIGRLATYADTEHPDPDKVLGSVAEEIVHLAGYMAGAVRKGILLKELKTKNPSAYARIGQTAENISLILEEFTDIIQTLWITEAMPASIFEMPEMIRHVVLVSDTDSTIFSNDFWTKWFTGSINFEHKSFQIGHTTTFLTANVVAHLLRKMSVNLGCIPEHLNVLKAKNEFYFTMFITTTMSKHYGAYQYAKEGNIHGKPKTEIKGKNLRDSTLPKYVMEGVDKMFRFIMDTTMEKGGLTSDQILGRVYDMEQQIYDNILHGVHSDLSTMMIKAKETYSNPVNNYRHHEMWEQVWGPKYGHTESAPYRAIKVSTPLDSVRKTNEWVASIEDVQLRARLEHYIQTSGRVVYPTLYLPEAMVKMNGIPEEIIKVIDVRKLIYGTITPFYMLLESCGFYIVDERYKRLVSDVYAPEGEVSHIPAPLIQ